MSQPIDIQDILAKLELQSIQDQVPTYKTNFTWVDKVFDTFAYLGMLFIFQKVDNLTLQKM